eukprot:CAMPEP_0195025918 /NCGR_PEP_ID=MMETSP0326_2-20130528/48937_1 /TAXON_ID=2866 ORGANISM="Crypthecodinium cohnii, Strain Seligo" /NCGR_SAMPLE_ID=MMETSP0326_2 /ASSEMBLY_ACC=CAM_ASM_000348 /LENGTH=71 /DNA_ID=CAMNT_0040047527 /DNA_START=228 /DNA_END=440 /DNA_ORIENTATION=-
MGDVDVPPKYCLDEWHLDKFCSEKLSMESFQACIGRKGLCLGPGSRAVPQSTAEGASLSVSLILSPERSIR